MAKKQIHNTSETVRVAVYARFSCDKQRDASIEDQVFEARRYCESRDYEIVNVYADYAMSGRSDDRPQFLAMVADAQAGMFDVVLVWKMDRFARNMQDQFYHEKILADAGVRLESVKENITGNGIEASMSKGMHAIFAQVRSQQSAEDTMRGMVGKARKCQYLGYQWLGYTHEGDEIIIDPATAPIAKGIHTRYLSGRPINEIVDWVNGQGVTNRNGKPVGYSFVTGILKNWVYAGVYTWGKVKDERGRELLDADGQPIPLVRVDGGIPAIVTVDEKEACLKRLAYRKHSNGKTDFLLSGKLYCPECGNPMHGETCKVRSGDTLYRYVCRGKRKACNGVYWKEDIESAIAKTVRTMLSNRETIEHIADRFVKFRANKKPEASIEAAREELKSLRKQRNNLIKAVEEGMPYKHVQAKLDKLDAQEGGIERRINELMHADQQFSKEDVLNTLLAIADGMQSDEEIVRSFISQVWVYDDQAVAVMNFFGKSSTAYEINAAYKKTRNTRSTSVSSNSKMVPPNGFKTSRKKTCLHSTPEGAAVILLESGFGVLISLKAA